MQKFNRICLLLGASLVFIGTLLGETNATFYTRDEANYAVQAGQSHMRVIDSATVSQTVPVNAVTSRTMEIENQGDMALFVRVLVLPVAVDENGVQLAVTPRDLLRELDATYWQLGEDGYFYYQKKLTSQQKTEHLFQKLQPTQKGTLTLVIKAEAISAESDSFVAAWWQGKIPAQATLKKIYETLKASQ